MCGRAPTGRCAVSFHGEVTCGAHAVSGACALCARPMEQPPAAGWTRLGAVVHRCPRCGLGAVGTQARVREELPLVRRSLRNLGFRLPTRVRVRLVAADELPSPSIGRHPSGTVFGATRLVDHGDGVDVVDMLVLAGLTPTHFGRTVAHESGHAWLAQTGCRPRHAAIEEGFCELLAYAWLKRRPGDLAAALRHHLVSNPDPVYGDGFRAVHAATRRHGIRTVVASLATSRALP